MNKSIKKKQTNISKTKRRDGGGHDTESLPSKTAMEEIFKRTVAMIGAAEGVLEGVPPGDSSHAQAVQDSERGVPLKDNVYLHYDKLLGLDIRPAVKLTTGIKHSEKCSETKNA